MWPSIGCMAKADKSAAGGLEQISCSEQGLDLLTMTMEIGHFAFLSACGSLEILFIFLGPSRWDELVDRWRKNAGNIHHAPSVPAVTEARTRERAEHQMGLALFLAFHLYILFFLPFHVVCYFRSVGTPRLSFFGTPFTFYVLTLRDRQASFSLVTCTER